jgi:hypothetical protein
MLGLAGVLRKSGGSFQTRVWFVRRADVGLECVLVIEYTILILGPNFETSTCDRSNAFRARCLLWIVCCFLFGSSPSLRRACGLAELSASPVCVCDVDPGLP